MRDIMLFLHFLGLAMGVGTSIVMMVLGKASTKLEADERIRFGLFLARLRFIGQIGLAVLILTGGYLMTPYWGALANMPYLIVKLVLVLILTIIVVLIGINTSKAMKSNTPVVYFKRNSTLGPLGLLTALATMVMAVMTFH
jgi:hypothetical protein